MKISTIKFLSPINNYAMKQFINKFIDNLGMLKRDLIQNKTDQTKDGIPMSAWNCTRFMINKIGGVAGIVSREMTDFQDITLPADKMEIIYDLEECVQNHSTTLCSLFLRDPESQALFIIDILNSNMLLINDKGIYRLDLGPRIKLYSGSTKIYSVICNAILFNRINKYKEIDISKYFTIAFRPLYEKIYIQPG